MDAKVFIEQFCGAILGSDPSRVTEDTVLAELPEWDSLALLNILAMVESEYGVLLPGAEILGCRTVGDLRQLVLKRQAA